MDNWNWQILDFEDCMSSTRYHVGLPPLKYTRQFKPDERFLAKFKFDKLKEIMVLLCENEITIRTWETTGTRRLGAEVGVSEEEKDFILMAFEKDEELKHILYVWKDIMEEE